MPHTENPPDTIENQANWFSFSDLKNLFPYKKVQNANQAYQQYINVQLIPSAINFVQRYTGWTWATPPDEILMVARNYAVNMILADDENIKIAQARGQPSFIVSGDTVNLDLTLGRNPLLSDTDEAILEDWRAVSDQSIHVDKVVVRTQGQQYEDAEGRDTAGSTDYIREDRLPGYFGGS